MYAITDIETTGSYPADNGITEIAIVLHNGKEVEGRFETLINPGIKIPKFISHLTGISNDMLYNAPTFEDVADRIFNLLQDRIFVAHNVNFDYTFIKHHLRSQGYEWNAKKLCTLKLSRKAFPGYTKYGLGHICRQLDINVQNRHRAGGDADATAVLFSRIIEQGGSQMIHHFLKKENHEQILPPHVAHEQVNALPYSPGVYYFHDEKGKVIYVGKAKSLKRRVLSHFTGLNAGSKRQEFLRNIHSISFSECATEFTAALFESVEIKRLWPAHNVSQKNFEKQFGIYLFEDSTGYLRLAIDRKKRYLEPVATFGLMSDAHRTLWKLVKNHKLHPALCFLDQSPNALLNVPEKDYHNERVHAALNEIQLLHLSYAIAEPCAFGSEYACVLIENGIFYGMGVIASPYDIYNNKKLKEKLTQYPENEVIKSLIRNYAEKYPSKVYLLKEE